MPPLRDLVLPPQKTLAQVRAATQTLALTALWVVVACHTEPSQPCDGLELPPRLRVTGFSPSPLDRPRGVDLDSMEGPADETGPDGVANIDDRTAVFVDYATAAGSIGAVSEVEVAQEIRTDGSVCQAIVRMGSGRAVARGTRDWWEAGPFSDLPVLLTVTDPTEIDYSEPNVIAQPWLLMRDGELLITGAVPVAPHDTARSKGHRLR